MRNSIPCGNSAVKTSYLQLTSGANWMNSGKSAKIFLWDLRSEIWDKHVWNIKKFVFITTVWAGLALFRLFCELKHLCLLTVNSKNEENIYCKLSWKLNNNRHSPSQWVNPSSCRVASSWKTSRNQPRDRGTLMSAYNSSTFEEKKLGTEPKIRPWKKCLFLILEKRNTRNFFQILKKLTCKQGTLVFMLIPGLLWK